MLSFALRSIASAYLQITYVLSVGDKSTLIPREVLRWNERQKTTELNRAGWPEKRENLPTTQNNASIRSTASVEIELSPWFSEFESIAFSSPSIRPANPSGRWQVLRGSEQLEATPLLR